MDAAQTEHRAREADLLARNELLNEAFETIEQRAYEEILRLPMWARALKYRALVERIKAIRDVRQHLQTVIKRGDKPAARPRVV